MSATDVVTGHLQSLQSRLAGRTNESPEALLNDLVPNLVRSLSSDAGRPGVDLRGQAYEGNLGRPDFSVKDQLLLIGHIETKAPGEGADTAKFKKGHNRDQWQRFKRLPNLIYTDGTAFGLYRSGERVGPVLHLTFDEADPKQTAESAEVSKLIALLGDFLSYRAVAPRSLIALAEQLAPLCAVLRDAVLERLQEPGSEVSKAARDVRDALFGDRSDPEVADAIAQVCSYSMLLARANGAVRLDAPSVEATLSAGHPVLGRVVTVLLDRGTEQELGWALDTVRALIEAVDFTRLRKEPLPGMQHYQRTWLYFYETFLAKYDPKLRDQYGVYYTPAPVIQAQVRLLDEVLTKKLGKDEGLASPGITVLDPAVGTGSYALEVIESVAERVRDSRGEGAVPSVVTALAKNLFAFEVLVGPYAVAHLRVSEILQDFDARQPSDGLRVYLTDTLSNPYSEQLSLTRQLEPLVEEQKRATRVKGQQEILVCLGNPPYERLSAVDESGVEKGGWVVHGEGGGAQSIFRHFSGPARKRTAVGHLRSLYNSYAFFWRWALWKVFEAPNVDGSGNDQPGVVSFITASSFLTGPGFLAMREHMRRLCDDIWVIDLGGDNRGARKEPNVFAIETPVAITIAIRTGATNANTPAPVHYTRIRGTRQQKLDRLLAIRGLDDFEWDAANSDWDAVFTPASTSDWEAHPALTDLFPLQVPGPVIARTWPVAITKANAQERWAALKAAPKDDKGKYFDDKRFGRSSTTQSGGGHPPPADLGRIIDLKPESADPKIERYGYRSFDRRWILADARLMRTPTQPLWAQHSDEQIYLVSMLTNVLGTGPAATVTAHIPDYHFFANRGGKDVIPLYRDKDKTPNVTAGLLDALESFLGPTTAEQLFAYAVAVIGHSQYTATFWEHLETPGPRVPLTTDRSLFDEAAALGDELIALQTFGARGTKTKLSGKARIKSSIGPDMPEDFAYDPGSGTLRVGAGGEVSPVAQPVWNYNVSGFEVVRAWLRGRLRDPTGRAKTSKSPLDHMRPSQWTSELDDELLQLLWTVERILQIESKQADVLSRVLAGDLIRSDVLPQPTAGERKPTPLPGQQGSLLDSEGEDDLEVESEEELSPPY